MEENNINSDNNNTGGEFVSFHVKDLGSSKNADVTSTHKFGLDCPLPHVVCKLSTECFASDNDRLLLEGPKRGYLQGIRNQKASLSAIGFEAGMERRAWIVPARFRSINTRAGVAFQAAVRAQERHAAELCQKRETLGSVQKSNEEEEESETPSKCLQKDCVFYGTKANHGYCSSCAQGRTPGKIQNTRKPRNPHLLYLPLGKVVGGSFPKWSPNVEEAFQPATDFDHLIFVSHRWQSKGKPDVSGVEAAILRQLLTEGGFIDTRKEREERNILDYSWNPRIYNGHQIVKINEIESKYENAGEGDGVTKMVNEDRIGVFYDWSILPQHPRTDKEEKLFQERLSHLNDYIEGTDTTVIFQAEDYNERTWCLSELATSVLALNTLHVTKSFQWPVDMQHLHGMLTEITFGVNRICDRANQKTSEGAWSHSCEAHQTAPFREVLSCPDCLYNFMSVEFEMISFGGATYETLSSGVAAVPLVLFRNTTITGSADVAVVLDLFHRQFFEAASSVDPIGLLTFTKQIHLGKTLDFLLSICLRYNGSHNPSDGVPFDEERVRNEVVAFTRKYETGYALQYGESSSNEKLSNSTCFSQSFPTKGTDATPLQHLSQHPREHLLSLQGARDTSVSLSTPSSPILVGDDCCCLLL